MPNPETEASIDLFLASWWTAIYPQTAYSVYDSAAPYSLCCWPFAGQQTDAIIACLTHLFDVASSRTDD